MTEQEAEALAARLTRVWAPDLELQEKVNWSNSGRFGFSVHIQPDVRFYCSKIRFFVPTGTMEKFQFHLERKTENHCTGRLVCLAADGQVVSLRTQSEKNLWESFNQFAAEWRLFFRRGCWLSGLPVDATAHEKAEWMQGSSHEEIEAWNLKM